MNSSNSAPFQEGKDESKGDNEQNTAALCSVEEEVCSDREPAAKPLQTDRPVSFKPKPVLVASSPKQAQEEGKTGVIVGTNSEVNSQNKNSAIKTTIETKAASKLDNGARTSTSPAAKKKSGKGATPNAADKVKKRNSQSRSENLGGSVLFSAYSAHAPSRSVHHSSQERVRSAAGRSQNQQSSCIRVMDTSQGTGGTKSNNSSKFFSVKSRFSRKGEEDRAQVSSTDARKMSVRTKSALIFFFLEFLLGLLVWWILRQFSASITKFYEDSAKLQVKLMDTTYVAKMNQMGFGSRGQAKNPTIIDFLETGEGRADVREVLQSEIYNRKIEYASLISLERTILASGNYQNNRTGDFFDPDGLVSYTIETASQGQVKASRVVELEELQREGPPIWRERASETQISAFNHPFDIGTDALVRYATTPVFDSVNGTKLLGILVVGDIVNGKTPICQSTVEPFGYGFSNVYHQEVGSSDFTPACTIATFSVDYANVQPLSAEFDQVPREFLREIAASDDASELFVAREGDLVMAGKKAPYGNQGGSMPVPGDISPGILVRGFAKSEDSTLTNMFITALTMIGIVIVLDATSVFGSILLFVAPLERLANRVLRKKKIRASQIKGIQIRGYFISVMVLIAVSSIVPAVLLMQEFENALNKSIETRTERQLGVAATMYQLKIDQMSLGFSGQSNNGAIKALLDAPEDSELRDAVQLSLQAEIDVRKIEIATLLDKNMRVVWDPNSKKRIGQYLNPEGIVGRALISQQRYKESDLLSVLDMNGMHLPIQQEKLDQTLPDSDLHPSITGQPGLFRYTATPVYADSNTDPEANGPDGVLLSGDRLNGKTILHERTLGVLESGYSAVYAYDCEKNVYYLVSSAYKSSKDAQTDIDVPLPGGTARTLLSNVRDSSAPETIWGEVKGRQHVFSARLVPKNKVVTAFGDVPHVLRTNNMFLVRGLAVKEVEAVIDEQNAWLSVMIALQCVKVVAVTVLCVMAYLPMMKLMKKLKIYKIGASN